MTSINLRPHQQSALSAMDQTLTGKIILPTGAGKSIVFIKNTIEQFQSDTHRTVCVVAPRLLLACQLSEEYGKYITNAKFLHVHSGSKLKHYRTTDAKNIKDWYKIHQDHHKLIFTSYNSLKRIIESGVKVDTYHFDECHNSVKKSFFPHIESAVKTADKKYFFTATPKNSAIPDKKPGMNIKEVYGDILCSVPMTEMVDKGFVIPPLVSKKEIENIDDIDERNCNLIIKTIDEENPSKILIAAKSTKSIISLIGETDFAERLKERDYSIMHITSAHGSFIDGKEVKRNDFFKTLNKWGNDPHKKFVVLNYGILGEGINIVGIDSIIFLRNMQIIELCQNIGRIIRLSKQDSDRIASGELTIGDYRNYKKPYGLVVLPVFDSYSKKVADAVESVIHKSFTLGEIISQETVK
jgi:superfamily II DNA or RNA helicase